MDELLKQSASELKNMLFESKEDENTPTQKVAPQVIENNGYRLKAEVLDKLLSKSKFILES
jgi:hypothetical protein